MDLKESVLLFEERIAELSGKMSLSWCLKLELQI